MSIKEVGLAILWLAFHRKGQTMSKTYGQMMQEALKIKTQEEADAWFKKEVEYMKDANPEWPMDKCADVVRSNLGYMAGYYNQEASKHVFKFFKAIHPIFGGPDYWGTVTAKQAFEKGKQMGESAR